MIEQDSSNVYWNYFLALENDLSKISRYIEFNEDNFQVYSIELAHLLLASASEVDVIMKQLCSMIDTDGRFRNINDYKECIKENLPDLIQERAFIPRFSITLNPWINWEGEENPLWWSAYNNVKHERNSFFKQANLKNTLNSIAGLLITNYFFQKVKIEIENGKSCEPRDVTSEIKPDPEFIRLFQDYYPSFLVF